MLKTASLTASYLYFLTSVLLRTQSGQRSSRILVSKTSRTSESSEVHHANEPYIRYGHGEQGTRSRTAAPGH